MAEQEPFNIPDLKDQVGWRLSEQDKRDLRILMASRRERSVSSLLRGLVQHEAAVVRRRWTAAVEPRSTEEA